MDYECESCQHYRADREVCQLHPEPTDSPDSGGCGQHTDRVNDLFNSQVDCFLEDFFNALTEVLSDALANQTKEQP